MNCDCGGRTRVIDTRGNWRRRKCLGCGKRFNTEEVLTTATPSVITEDKEKSKEKWRRYMANPENAQRKREADAARRQTKKATRMTKAEVKKQGAARRRIEELNDEKDTYNDLPVLRYDRTLYDS